MNVEFKILNYAYRISDNNHKDVLEGIAHSEERVKIATEKRKK